MTLWEHLDEETQAKLVAYQREHYEKPVKIKKKPEITTEMEDIEEIDKLMRQAPNPSRYHGEA